MRSHRIINHGEVVACDDTSALLGRLDAKTLLLKLAGAPRELPGIDGVRAEIRDDGQLALTYSRRAVAAPDLINAVQAQGIQITDITTEEPHLEDVFLALTSDQD